MPRIMSMLLVLALLAGTAAAFAVTEGLKLEPSPISGTRVGKVLSPVCHCRTRVARIAFRMRKADRLTLVVIDRDGDVVRTLIRGRRFRHGFVRFRWNGRDDAGRILPEGSYRPRVHLDRAHRTIVLPNPIRLDVTPPRITLVDVPRVFLPGGKPLQVVYRVSEPARPFLIVNGRHRVRGRVLPSSATLVWDGKVDGRALRAGRYRISLAARDRAGNVSRPTAPVLVRIRYIELARSRIHVRAGARFGVRVLVGAKTFRWQLGKRSGLHRAGLLVLRAPKPGRYVLRVEANGHADRALVIVEPRR